jgi:hypothetical protein
VPGLESGYLTQWLPGLLLSGLGVGMVLPSRTAAAVSRLPSGHYAVNQATRQIGSVIGVALTVLLVGQAGMQHGDFSGLYVRHILLALVGTAAPRGPRLPRPFTSGAGGLAHGSAITAGAGHA